MQEKSQKRYNEWDFSYVEMTIAQMTIILT